MKMLPEFPARHACECKAEYTLQQPCTLVSPPLRCQVAVSSLCDLKQQLEQAALAGHADHLSWPVQPQSPHLRAQDCQGPLKLRLASAVGAQLLQEQQRCRHLGVVLVVLALGRRRGARGGRLRLWRRGRRWCPGRSVVLAVADARGGRARSCTGCTSWAPSRRAAAGAADARRGGARAEGAAAQQHVSRHGSRLASGRGGYAEAGAAAWGGGWRLTHRTASGRWEGIWHLQVSSVQAGSCAARAEPHSRDLLAAALQLRWGGRHVGGLARQRVGGLHRGDHWRRAGGGAAWAEPHSRHLRAAEWRLRWGSRHGRGHGRLGEGRCRQAPGLRAPAVRAAVLQLVGLVGRGCCREQLAANWASLLPLPACGSQAAQLRLPQAGAGGLGRGGGSVGCLLQLQLRKQVGSVRLLGRGAGGFLQVSWRGAHMCDNI